jgi:hypothetical protein
MEKSFFSKESRLKYQNMKKSVRLGFSPLVSAGSFVNFMRGGRGRLWTGRRPQAKGFTDEDLRGGKTNPVLLTWFTLVVLAVVFSLVFFGRTRQPAGAQDAPGAGTVIGMGMNEMDALDETWGDRSGFIVWSSTMYGNHDLIRMDWPSGRLLHLTQGPFVDTTPKISPEGKRVAFARSRQEWVSFRNLDEWDIWVLDLETGMERLVAEHGAEPCWTGDGERVVFHRGGREIVQADVKTGKETVLLGARDRMIWAGPSMDPAGGRVAVTMRGKRQNTAIFAVPDGAETPVAGGCQLSFAPSGEELVLVEEEGGRMKNRICRVDRNGKNLETLIDMPGFWSHEYFPRVSNDGALLVFGAAREGHENDTADYEIFLWRIGEPWDKAARVSFHTGNDQWPDVWVTPSR